MRAMKLSSPAFENGGDIPEEYTCDGKQISPPLQISDVPATAKSLALIMEDPDAKAAPFVHWVLWNIPPLTTMIKKGETSMYDTGKTTSRKLGYVGPCPPFGAHHYYFTLYALDTTLSLKAGADKKEFEKIMAGHQLATAQLLGLYQRR
jgi:Raf kinase inhibitor-like YbhB/YbcL family protein